MKTRKNPCKYLLLALMAILVITGCTAPVPEPENPASDRGSITIRIGEDVNTRSIHPVIEKPATYEFSFERTDGKTEWPVPESFTMNGTETVRKVEGVHVGSYKVTVKGYNSSKALVMEGVSGTFTVSAGKDTPVSVQLSLIVDPLQKGNMKVVFDWSAITELAGPLKDAVDNGILMLKVLNAEEGIVENWPAPVTVTGVTGKTTAEFNVVMPVREMAWDIMLELCNADGICFYDFPASATIRSNITSVPVAGTEENLKLTVNPEGGKGPRSVYPYDVNNQNPETSVDIRIVTYPGASSIDFMVTDQDQTVTYRDNLPVTKSNDVYTVDGLAVGSTYSIAIKVNYANGLTSGWKTYPFLQNVKAKIPVKGVSLVIDGLSYDIDTGNAAFAIKANLNPLNATVQTGSWTFSDNSVFLAEGKVVGGPVAVEALDGVFTLNLTPAKPGKTTVTIKSDENFERAEISAVSQEFIVRLASPVSVSAAREVGGLGITVTWNKGDEFASKYEIYRKTDAEYSFLATVNAVDAATDTGFSYTDKALVGGTSYSYQVVAVHGTDATLNSKPTAVATPVTAARLSSPVITGTALQQDQKGILLTWTDSEVLADTFIIDRAVDNVWTDSWKTVTNVNELLDADITAGKSYKYRISAKSSSYVDGDFTSPKSAESTAVLAKMATPANTAAALNDDGMGITVSWNEGKGSVASSYIVARNVDGAWTENYGTVAAALSFNDDDITLGKTYEYRVSAANAAYGETFNSEASTAASVAVAEQNNTITVLPPVNGATITLTDKGSVKVVAEETPLTVNIADGIPGATSYRWTLDGMLIEGFTGSSVTVTFADCVKANPDYETRNSHVLALQSDNGVSATYRFNTEFFRIGSSAPAERLPLDAVRGPIYVWAESNDETGYTLSVVGATVDGEPVQDTNTVASIDEYGILTVNGYGDITIKATAEDGRRVSEMTLSFYDNTLPSSGNAVNEIISAVNAGIMPTFTTLAHNFEGDWWTGSGNDKVTVGESEAYRQIGAGYADPRFIFKNVQFTDNVTNIGSMSLNSNTIYVRLNGTSSYIGDSELKTFGYTSNATSADPSKNMVTVNLPGNQGTLDVCYMNLELMSTGVEGKFFIRFNSNCGTYDANAYQFKAGEWTEVVNNTGIDPQIKFKYR